MAVYVLGGTTFDLVVSGLPRLPDADDVGDEFTARSLVHVPGPFRATVGGNAGNVAFALARLGLRPQLVTPLGDDVLGEQLRRWLTEAGVRVTAVPPLETSVNVVATDTAGHRHSLFRPVQVDTGAALAQLDSSPLRRSDLVVIAGYPHPAPDVLTAWVTAGRDAGARVALDIGPALAGFTEADLRPLIDCIDVLFANDDELAALAPSEDVGTVMGRFAGELGTGLVRKRGTEGAQFIGAAGDAAVAAFPTRPGPTVGAGDVFNAGFLHALVTRGARASEALRRGAAAAALVLDRGLGVIRAPTAADVDAYLSTTTPERDKEQPMQQLPRWAERLRQRHPDAEMPSRDDPIPAWLAEETARLPLWYIIREAKEPRSEHPFLLHKEIHRQPGQWSEILDTRWDEVTQLGERFVDEGVERIITTGCGSAFFTAIHGAFTIPRIAGIETEAVESYELAHYFPAADPASTLVIGHSGTGGSIETVEAIQEARRRGCRTLAITNTEQTAVGRAADQTLTYVTSQECGPCTSVVSTRILLATMLAVAMAERRGHEVAAARAIREALPRVAAVGHDFLEQEEATVAKLAEQRQEATSWLLVGSGPHYFSAREGTLKIEEQAILIAKAYRTGDFHHDALSVVAPERPVVGIEAGGAANARVVDALRAAREGLSPTVAVTWSDSDGTTELEDAADTVIRLSGALPELVSPIPMTLVFQLLGYYLGVARGFNPDTLRTDHEPNTRAWLTSFPLGTH